jgi:hypothetical protein
VTNRLHALTVVAGMLAATGGGTALAAPGELTSHGAAVMTPAADVSRPIDGAQLRQDMRKLWTDHVIWTREYIVAAVDGAPDASAAAARLLRNQEDIGNAVGALYGRAAGDKLTGLLKQHIMIAVDVVAAAKAGDQVKYADASRRWTANGAEIADFLSQANPNWPRAALADMMNMHLATTTREVVARLNKRWDDDVAAFDEVYAHILKMSDALTDGIVRQFAASGRPSAER